MELATVLERLSAAGLTLKLKKCVFATREMEYLGHELSSDGVRPVQRLVTAVAEFPRPSDVGEVKRFVHLAGYYRKFIEAFGSIMAPMTRLLKKDQDWEWTEKQEFAFERVKAALTTKPLLVYPDFARPFRLVTDASKVGLGACLMQDQGRGWQPIAYASKVNSSAEMNYSITELECLAVVWSVKLFRPYLYGRVFEIITDHSALKWLMTRPNLAGRLHRWSLTLQEYGFEIVYRPGTTNVVADALSRAPAAVKAVTGQRHETATVAAPPTQTAALTTIRPAELTTEGTRNDGIDAGSAEERQPLDRPLTRAAKRRLEAAVAATAETTQRTGEAGGAVTTTPPGTEVTRAVKALGRHKQETTNESATMQEAKEETANGSGRPRRPKKTRIPDDGDGVTRSKRRKTTAQKNNAGKPGAARQRTRSGGGDPDAARKVRPPLAEGEESVPKDTTLQITDAEIGKAQRRSKLVQQLLENDEYRGMKVEKAYGLVTIHTTHGRRVVLPPALWAVVFKTMHGSVWAGHLRGPHTYGRVARLYWWPGLLREVNQWVRGCQECGSRKARPREVIPPLRPIRAGDVADRWALDVAPFPVADGGERYVIAAVEYVTRYAVARCTTQHTAESVASFLMEDVVLKFGVFQELLTDGAPELAGKVIEQLVELLQAYQINPVPYRPQMIGLVERFHRSWKDCVSMFMASEAQNDRNLWVKFAVYAYNSAQHSTVALTPNALMMARRLRAPNEFLRRTEVTEAGELMAYHRNLLEAMGRSHACAEAARNKKQERQARYYDRRVRQRRTFEIGDRVWVYNPPRGPKPTKYVHQWMGPMRIIESAGSDNFVLQREDKTGAPEVIIAHVSFLVSYYEPAPFLEKAAADLNEELADEDGGASRDVPTTTAAVRATTAGRGAATMGGVSPKRKKNNERNVDGRRVGWPVGGDTKTTSSQSSRPVRAPVRASTGRLRASVDGRTRACSADWR